MLQNVTCLPEDDHEFDSGFSRYLYKEGIKTSSAQMRKHKIPFTDSYKKDLELCHEQITLTENRVTSLTELFVMTFLHLNQ